MARITVEDCLDQIENRNRFHLSLLASRRARQLKQGATPMVHSEEDNHAVLALREVATGKLTPELLDEVDQELGEAFMPGEPGPGPSSESVAEAAEALGAGLAAGVEGSARSGAAEEEAVEGGEAAGEAEAAPEEPRLADQEGDEPSGGEAASGESPGSEQDAGEDKSSEEE